MRLQAQCLSSKVLSQHHVRVGRDPAAIASMSRCASQMSESRRTNYLIHGGDKHALQAQGTLEELEDSTVYDSQQQNVGEEYEVEHSTGRVNCYYSTTAGIATTGQQLERGGSTSTPQGSHHQGPKA